MKNFSTLNLGYVENSEDRINKNKQNLHRNYGEYVSSKSFYGSYYNNNNN